MDDHAQKKSIHGLLSRTKLCHHMMSTGQCSRGENCGFAHSEAELRRPPNLEKTRMCQRYKSGHCPDGEDCKFAHSTDELRVTDFFFKTKSCHMWRKGKCSQGDNCRHAHGYQDMARAKSHTLLPVPTVAASKSLDFSPRRDRKRRDSIGSYEGDPDAYPSDGFPLPSDIPILSHQETPLDFSDESEEKKLFKAMYETQESFNAPEFSDPYSAPSVSHIPPMPAPMAAPMPTPMTPPVTTPISPQSFYMYAQPYMQPPPQKQQLLAKIGHSVTMAQLALKTLALAILEADEAKIDEESIKESLWPLSHCITPYMSIFPAQDPLATRPTSHMDIPPPTHTHVLHQSQDSPQNARKSSHESVKSPLASEFPYNSQHSRGSGGSESTFAVSSADGTLSSLAYPRFTHDAAHREPCHGASFSSLSVVAAKQCKAPVYEDAGSRCHPGNGNVSLVSHHLTQGRLNACCNACSASDA